MSLIKFSLKYPLLSNMCLLFVFFLGVMSWLNSPQEVFPVFDTDVIKIATRFDGASPLEVERQVTLTIEETFTDAGDIDYIYSNSMEGTSSVYAKLKTGADVDEFMRDTKVRLDSIDDLPELAEEPQLSRLKVRFPVITLSLYGNVTDAELYDQANDIRQRMQRFDGVAGVGRTGVRDWELQVSYDPWVLAARGIPVAELRQALRTNLGEQAGGAIKSVEGEVRLRGKGVQPQPEVVRDVVLRSDPNGGNLVVGDVANVHLVFEEAKDYARFNGKPSVNLTVTKLEDASIITIADQVKDLAVQLRSELPPGISVGLHTDMSEYVKVRLNAVKSSGIIGLAMVLLSLYVLLNFRVALITAFGIPVSFLFVIILLYYLGYSINMVSLFAFLIVLGMIVDDAIIVTENIYRHVENGMDRAAAAWRGAREVFWPVVVSTLTTIAAFLPMFAIGGVLGAFIEVIPVVVSFALLGSLLEAFAVLPGHCAAFIRTSPRHNTGAFWQRFMLGYKRILRRFLDRRWLVMAASVAVLLFTFIYVFTRMPFQLFDDVDTGEFFVNVETATTYSLEDSLELAEKLEKNIQELLAADMENMQTNIGVAVVDENLSKRGSNITQFVIDLEKESADGFIENWITPLVSLGFENFGSRLRNTDEVMQVVRTALEKEIAIQRLSIVKPEAGPPGDDLEIGIVGDDLQLLRAKIEEMKLFLTALPGVYDVVHDQDAGKAEYEYTLNEQGKRLGLNQGQIANFIRSGYVGDEVIHVTHNDERIVVRLLYDEKIRTDSSILERLPLVLESGKVVYLGNVVDIKTATGTNQIRRRDQRRMAKLTGSVDDNITTSAEVLELVDQKFAGDPNYSLVYLGEKKNAEESFKGMKQALFIGLGIIFFILTALFGTWRDPFVVMSAIPFGLIGVVGGHVLLGYNLQFLSVIGILALSGIIVNDSLILIEFIKRLRAEGSERIDAVVEACAVRARPILLTTITTFLGVSPLIFFSTGQTAFMAPMAVSLGFGLCFATVLILLTLPCWYLIIDDLLPPLKLPAKASTDIYESRTTSI